MRNADRNLWVDYLRSAITVLVVAHHASLAYTTFAWFDKTAYNRSTHPVVDTNRWIGLDIFENFNDVFFMSLMFLIGGLFLTRSISKKGASLFIKDRFYRLFVPFLFLGTILMLIAYFPAYYLAHNSIGLWAYLVDFFTVEKWPVGPPWFIWMLFIFNLLFALFYAKARKTIEKTGIKLAALKNRPFVFFIILFGITWLLYVPLAHNTGPGTWIGMGPFDFQLSRILLYFGYFVVGIIIGNFNFNEGLFAPKSAMVKTVWLWVFLALTTYAILTIMSKPLQQLVNNETIPEFTAWMIYFVVYTASCTLSSIAFITLFRKITTTGKQWMNSLSENAYLIYLIHYIFVVWIQFLLLQFDLPAFIKFLITFTAALALSWITSHLLRKIEIVKKYL